MAEVIRAIPEGEPRKKNTLIIHIETEDANKKLDELIEKANQLKATLRECGIPADLEKTGGTEEMRGTMREYLKKLRESNGYTMQYVADRIGISKQYYQRIEVGDRQQNMDITLAVKLSEIFGVTIENIIKNEKELSLARESAKLQTASDSN